MLILLKIAAILALIILPLIPPKKQVKSYKIKTDASGFVVDESGKIQNA